MDKFWQKNKSAFLYARELTKEYSKSFYVSSLLLPKPQRWATFAVYGFCRYVDNLIDKPRKRTAEDIRTEIENLKSELTLAYQSGESEHPVISPFITTALHFDIPIEYPLELITGVLMDLDKKIYQTFDDLYLFCYRVAGVVGLMMTHITGYTNKDAFVCAEKLGIAFQLTNILRDIKEDKDMGRIYIP
ncbi:phytoene/squalene synthase family protein, partial [candidate division KSB1 bacterium]|nr:phytoene/squalene synthase family protein [candidate division KSB1 bacterium]